MAIFKSLLARLIPQRNKRGIEDLDHYQRLERLRANHDWIDVVVTKNKRSYQSLILDIDIENSELIIDDLYPPENLDVIETGDTVEVSSQSRRVLVNFYSRVLARETRADKNGEQIPCYRLELPEEVGKNHSRSSYRVYVESEPDLNLEMYLEGKALSDVRVINLSSEGLKVSFADDVAGQFSTNQAFTDCIIRLPDEVDIDCDIELRNIYKIRTPHPHSLAGGKLTIHSPQQLNKLQQYLAAVQRKKRRLETRQDLDP